MSRREVSLDSRRLALAAAAAVAIHAGLFFAIPAILRLESRRTPDYGGTVLVQLEEPAPPQEMPVVEQPPQPAAAEPVPEPAPLPEPAPQPRPAPAPRTAPATPVAKPAPKTRPAAQTPAPSAPVVTPAPPPLPKGPAFREAGEKTGIASPLPAASPAGAPSPAQAVAGPEPTLPAAGSPRGGAPAADSVQKSGVGVAVPAQTARTSVGTAAGSSGSPGPSLDLGALDKALASGSSRTVSPPTRSAAAAGTGDFSVVWDEPDAAKGRELLSAPRPTLPRRVQEEGLTLSMTVSFSVAPEGVIAQARVARSSGYADVDAAVLEALRRWRFTAAETTRTVSGTIPYTIRAR